MIVTALLSTAAVNGFVLLVAPEFIALPILTSIVTLAAMFWFGRPSRTLLRADGIHAPGYHVNWDELLHWEMYDNRRALSLSVRSHLLRIDAFPVEIRLYQNQAEAEQILRDRVPNGRVLP